MMMMMMMMMYGKVEQWPRHKTVAGVFFCVQDLREVFEMEAKQTGRDRLLLTIAAAGGSYFISVAYEPHKIIQYVLHVQLI